MKTNEIKIIHSNSTEQSEILLSEIINTINQNAIGLNYFEIIGVLEEAKCCVYTEDEDGELE